ncbi:MAG: helicase HerA-like domain-containing protein [Anaerolineae bacterium]
MNEGEDKYFLGRVVERRVRPFPDSYTVSPRGDFAGQALGDLFFLPARDLLTHVMILGVTGSGKTVLGKVLIEEATMKGVPSIAVDLKGDLASIGLVFPELTPQQLAPWVEAWTEEERRNKAYREVERFHTNLKEFSLDQERLAGFAAKFHLVIFTPKSTKGIPLAVSSLPRAPSHVDQLLGSDPETFLLLVDNVAESLAMRLYGQEGRTRIAETKLLSEIISHAWKNGISLEGETGLKALVELVMAPPFERIGVMNVDDYVSASDRHSLAKTINHILIGAEQLWDQGIPLDIDLWLLRYGKEERTPIFVVSMADLTSFEDQNFVVSRIAYAVYEWMRTKGGADRPRLLFYVDEIGGGGGKTAFFPVHPYNPPSKPPLMLLLKQARSFGVSCVFATQNPGDVDYKGLSNCGTWMIGKLPTERDREKVFQGLGDAELTGIDLTKKRLGQLIASLETGEFIVKTKRGDVEHIRERWLMSYHRTLTSPEIRKLTGDKEIELALQQVPSRPQQPAAVSRYFLPVKYPCSPDVFGGFLKTLPKYELAQATVTFAPILVAKPRLQFRCQYPNLRREIQVELEHDALMSPLYEEAEGSLVSERLGVTPAELKAASLQEKGEGADFPTLDLVVSHHQALDRMGREVSQALEDALKTEVAKHVQEECEEVVEEERSDYKDRLNVLKADRDGLDSQIDDIRDQISALENELKSLQYDRDLRKRQNKPIVQIGKSIKNRKRRIADNKNRMRRYEEKRSKIEDQIRHVQDARDKRERALREAYEGYVEGVLSGSTPEIGFVEVTEVCVPICEATVRLTSVRRILGNRLEFDRTIQLVWNGFNGTRLDVQYCEKCDREASRQEPILLCAVCLSTLCQEHVNECNDCFGQFCEDHSWLCTCGKRYCLEVPKSRCAICGTVLCPECVQICEIGEEHLCSEHVVKCSVCKGTVCEQHSWKCDSCGNSLCDREASNRCAACSKQTCENCSVVCAECEATVCKDHTAECGICGKVYCTDGDHFTECQVCSQEYCIHCVETCEACGHPACEQDIVECPNCCHSVCTDCLVEKKRWLGLQRQKECPLCHEKVETDEQRSNLVLIGAGAFLVLFCFLGGLAAMLSGSRLMLQPTETLTVQMEATVSPTATPTATTTHTPTSTSSPRPTPSPTPTSTATPTTTRTRTPTSTPSSTPGSTSIGMPPSVVSATVKTLPTCWNQYDVEERLVGMEILDALRRFGGPQTLRQVILEGVGLVNGVMYFCAWTSTASVCEAPGGALHIRLLTQQAPYGLSSSSAPLPT